MIRTLNKFRSTTPYLNKYVISSYSTVPAKKEIPNVEDEIKEFERISNITQRIKTKNPQKPPFVKNLLLGKFDTDILAYPELEKDELQFLQNNLQKVKPFLNQPEISTSTSKELLEKFGREKLLGLQTSQLMGGRELKVTEAFRFTEALSEVALKHNVINNENLGIQILLKFGSDRLKKKYLQRLIDGEAVSAFCVLEPFTDGLGSLNRTAVLSSDGKSWVLNGKRDFVINGSSADFYIIIAETDTISKHEIKEHKLTAFLVERDYGGVITSRQNTVDSTIELSNMAVQNTVVPSDNVIGEIGKGEDILSKVLVEYRLGTGPVCTVLLKNLINKTVEYFIANSQEPLLLYETDAVRSRIAELVTSLYAVESTLYLTTGLIDNYENQDCELESTILKVLASEQALLSTSSCLDLIGPEASLESHWCSKLHKEAICQVTLNDNNDKLKSLIAIFGLKYAGQELADTVRKLRNPLFYSGFILKRMWTHRRQSDDKPKLNIDLHHHLHPSLIIPANWLEYCVLRLQYATEILFTRYGQDIILKHIELRRLAECLIDVYAMTACLSRASRSYCIGLQHSDLEILLASTFCGEAMERVKARIKKIVDGHYQTNDENYRAISERTFRFKKYCPVHPLSRNF